MLKQDIHWQYVGHSVLPGKCWHAIVCFYFILINSETNHFDNSVFKRLVIQQFVKNENFGAKVGHRCYADITRNCPIKLKWVKVSGQSYSSWVAAASFEQSQMLVQSEEDHKSVRTSEICERSRKNLHDGSCKIHFGENQLEKHKCSFEHLEIRWQSLEDTYTLAIHALPQLGHLNFKP